MDCCNYCWLWMECKEVIFEFVGHGSRIWDETVLDVTGMEAQVIMNYLVARALMKIVGAKWVTRFIWQSNENVWDTQPAKNEQSTHKDTRRGSGSSDRINVGALWNEKVNFKRGDLEGDLRCWWIHNRT